MFLLIYLFTLELPTIFTDLLKSSLAWRGDLESFLVLWSGTGGEFGLQEKSYTLCYSL